MCKLRRRALADVMQYMSVESEKRALVASDEVVQKVAALYTSDDTDSATKLSCAHYMGGLITRKETRPFAFTLRVAIVRFFMDVTLPNVEPRLLTTTIHLLKRVIALESDDRSYDLKELLRKGFARHALQLLEESMQYQTFEEVRQPLLQTIAELASFTDNVEVYREILDVPLAACIVREQLRLLEHREWRPLAELNVMAFVMLTEPKGSPFLRARQRFQEAYLERGGKVSAAIRRDSATGLDVVVAMLRKGPPALSNSALLMLGALCIGHGLMQEALRNDERVMELLRRVSSEPGHPGSEHAGQLLHILSSPLAATS